MVAGIGLIETWIHVNSKTMLPKWASRHNMVIDAKIVRHGRSAVVNIIEKHSRFDQKVIRMMPQRGLGPPFWCPWGGLDLLFGFLRVPCGPWCPPGGFIEDFGGHFGGHLETKID